MSSKLGQKGTFMMLEKYLTTIHRIKLRCLVKRGICLLLVSRTWIVHCFAAYLKQLIIFFPVFFHLLSLSFDSTFPHVLFPQSQLFFLNKRHSFCSRVLFIYHNSNSDRFFPRNFFLVVFKSFEGERSKIWLTFFFPRYAERVRLKAINTKGISSLLLRNY